MVLQVERTSTMQDIIQEVKQRTQIIDIITLYATETPQKKGSNYVLKSPFLAEKTPSCVVFVKTNTFKDFSSGNSGDGIKFVQLLYGINALEASKKIANDFNIYVDSSISKAEFTQIDRARKIENLKQQFIEQDINNLFKTLARGYKLFRDLRECAEALDPNDIHYKFIVFNEYFFERHFLRILNNEELQLDMVHNFDNYYNAEWRLITNAEFTRD